MRQVSLPFKSASYSSTWLTAAFSCQPCKSCLPALLLSKHPEVEATPPPLPTKPAPHSATQRPLWLCNARQRQGLDPWSHRSTSPFPHSLSSRSEGVSAALEKAGPALPDRPRLAALALRSPEVLPSIPVLSRCRRGYRAAPEVLPCLPPSANMAVDSGMELLFLDTFKHPNAEVRLRFLIPTLLLDFGTLTKNRASTFPAGGRLNSSRPHPLPPAGCGQRV